MFFLILGNCTGGVLSPFPFRYLPSFKGNVIDVETKQPIPGAVVLAVHYKELPSVAGSNSYFVDAQETLTNEQGEFKTPWKLRWFVAYRGYAEGKLTIFKPGYGVFPKHRGCRAVGENKTWPSPWKRIVYELPKLKTREERKRNARMRTYHEIPYEKQRLYIEAINAERKSLGFPLMQVPDN